MIAGIDGLGDELRVLRKSVVAALLREARRLVAEYNDNFVFDVQISIVVIVEFVGRNAVSREDYRSCDICGGRKAKGNKILIDL